MKKKISEEKHVKYIKKLGSILSDSSVTNSENIKKCHKRLIERQEFVNIFSNLNEYANNETKVLCNILKSIVKNSKTFMLEEVEKFLEENVQNIVDALFENLKKIKSDYVVFVVFKILKRILKNEKLNSKVLTLEFFKELFFFTKNEKFVVSFEAFKIIFLLIEDKKINAIYFSSFLNKFKKEFCEIINSTLTTKNINDDYYIVKRETLKIVIRILSKEDKFDEFKIYYVSSVDNLKITMGLLNHNCFRIKQKAIYILYYFLIDLDLREKSIQNILLANKNNFENYFDKLQDSDCEVMEKKTYILYELERLPNIS